MGLAVGAFRLSFVLSPMPGQGNFNEHYKGRQTRSKKAVFTPALAL
jgi:hypothetical protein